MKGNFIAPRAKVLSVEKRTSQDGKINWTEVTVLMDSAVNTINCDNKLSEELKVGSTYDFVVNLSEEPKSYKNGGGAYMVTKFKITSVVKS